MKKLKTIKNAFIFIQKTAKHFRKTDQKFELEKRGVIASDARVWKNVYGKNPRHDIEPNDTSSQNKKGCHICHQFSPFDMACIQEASEYNKHSSTSDHKPQDVFFRYCKNGERDRSVTNLENAEDYPCQNNRS
jgi:hypothetical protein